MIALLLLQAAITATPPTKIDLLAQKEQCAPGGDDIVICGRPVEQRLKPLEAPASNGPPDGPLSFRLPGGGTANVHAIRTELPGAVGQGAVVTLKLPLGKRAKPIE